MVGLVRRGVIWAIWGVLGFLAVVFAMGILSDAPGPAVSRPAPVADPASLPRQMCREFIREGLHDPGSVEWLPGADWPVADLGDGLWRVTATFRATNAFGARVLSRQVCDMRDDGGAWRLLSLAEG